MPNSDHLYIHTLLVRPKYPRNIGQCVRATMNCGFGKLFIIAPQCEVYTSESRMGAAGAQKELEEREVFESWEGFNQRFPSAFKIGMTRRIGKHRKLFPFETGIESFFERVQEDQGDHFRETKKEIFLVFGPEDDGLATSDLNHVNMCCYLPIYGDFKSLNLAQAVLLSQHLSHQKYFSQFVSSTPQSSKSFLDYAVESDHFPDASLKLWLSSMGFQLAPDKLNAFETIKKMIMRSFPSKKELGTFEKALRQSLKSMEE